MMNEAQDKRVEGINIRLSLDALSYELIDELNDVLKANKGSERVHISVFNPLTCGWWPSRWRRSSAWG